MSLPISGDIKLIEIQTEFDANSLEESGVVANIPLPVAITDFYGLSAFPPFINYQTPLEGESLTSVYKQPNGVWLAGSNVGRVNVSDNAVEWNRFSTSRTNHIQDVEWAPYFVDDLWVTVGNAGTIQSSSNSGQSWNHRFGSTLFSFLGCHRHMWTGRWVAVGNHGRIYTSDGTIRWARRTAGVPAEANLRSVYYGDGIWIAVGATHTGSTPDREALILRSTDHGISWNRITNWSPTTTFLHKVHYSWVDDLWILVGANSTIATSSDGGLSWTNRTSPVNASLRSVHRIDDRPGFGGQNNDIPLGYDDDIRGFQSLDDNIWVISGSDGVILTSNNGFEWTNRSSGVSSTIRDVHIIPGMIVGVTDGSGVIVAKIPLYQRIANYFGFTDVNSLSDLLESHSDNPDVMNIIAKDHESVLFIANDQSSINSITDSDVAMNSLLNNYTIDQLYSIFSESSLSVVENVPPDVPSNRKVLLLRAHAGSWGTRVSTYIRGDANGIDSGVTSATNSFAVFDNLQQTQHASNSSTSRDLTFIEIT